MRLGWGFWFWIAFAVVDCLLVAADIWRGAEKREALGTLVNMVGCLVMAASSYIRA